MAGTFDMFIEKDKKVFRAFAEGFFTMDDGLAFVTAFEKKAKGLSDYALIIDCKGVKPTSQEVAEALGQAIRLYVETPFRDRYMVKQASAVGHMQFKRLSNEIFREIGLPEDTLVYVESKEEAYSIIG